MTTIIGLWHAADALTQPGTERIHRAPADTDLAGDLLHDLANNPRRTLCAVAEYRAATELRTAQTRSYGTVPCLWDQAAAAVSGQGDSDEGGGVPARERSVADLALIETLFTVREVLAAELKDRGLAPRASVPLQIRQVASVVAASSDEDAVEWWTRRLDQFARIIAGQLNTVDHGPKPIRLRDSVCPECGAGQVRVQEQGEWRLVPPLRIDFRDGMVRAATCHACGHAWMRGDGLNDLAEKLGRGVLAPVAESA